MTTTITDRLATLRREYEEGQRALADLESRQRQLRDTMLRISGAIQVLEELQASLPSDPEPSNPAR